MGSFDYSDDYSSFANLLDRTTLLTEGGRGLGRFHPGFGKTLTSRVRDVGSGSVPFRSREFVVHILYGMLEPAIITDEELDHLRAQGGAAGSKYNLALQQILDNHKDEITQRADEISDAIEERFSYLANKIMEVDPKRIGDNINTRQVKLATKEIEKEIKSGKDLDDSISDNVEKVLANAAVYATLTNAQGRVDDRDLDIVEKYATQFVNSFNDLDVLIKKLKTFDTENFNVLADEISNSLSSVKGRAGISQDDEDPYAGVNDPGNPEGEEYSSNEEGGGTTSIVDSLNNNMRKRKLLFEKKKNWIQGAVDPDHKGYCTPMSKETCTPHRKALARRFKKGISDEEEELHPATRAAEEIIGSLVTWEPDSGVPESGAPPEAISRRSDGLMKGEVVDVDVEKGIAVVETGFGIPAERYVVELGELIKVIPRAPREEEEHEGDLQRGPMLDSYQSDTSNYLTEQAASDKRNKKSEVKNESFKERYKPKTHWQLEELKRYGL